MPLPPITEGFTCDAGSLLFKVICEYNNFVTKSFDVDNQGNTADEPIGESASQTLALLEEHRRKVGTSLFSRPAPILAAWGFAYLVGFGLLWITYGGHGGFADRGAVLVLAGLGILASVVAVTRMTRIGQGVDGPSRRSATMFSWCWPAALLGVSAFDVGLSRHGMSTTALSLLWPGSFLLVVAVLFLCAGVIFGDRSQFGLGLWSLTIAAASTFAGTPGNFAELALAGGGGLLVAAGSSFLASHRTQVARGEQ